MSSVATELEERTCPAGDGAAEQGPSSQHLLAAHMDPLVTCARGNIDENITKDNIYLLSNVQGILVNCCRFNKMITFFNTIPKIYYKDKIIGFYCNKIDEKKYNTLTEIAK